MATELNTKLIAAAKKLENMRTAMRLRPAANLCSIKGIAAGAEVAVATSDMLRIRSADGGSLSLRLASVLDDLAEPLIRELEAEICKLQELAKLEILRWAEIASGK